jgi:hypothetical protein
MTVYILGPPLVVVSDCPGDRGQSVETIGGTRRASNLAGVADSDECRDCHRHQH